MKTSTQMTVLISMLTLTTTLGYQQCAPAKFNTEANPTVAKFEGDETVADPDLGDIPVVACEEDMTDIGDKDSKGDEQASHSSYSLAKDCKKKEKPKKSPPSSKKCTVICHVPPGNPAQAKSMVLPLSAVKAHLAQHESDDGADHIGPCELPEQAL